MAYGARLGVTMDVSRVDFGSCVAGVGCALGAGPGRAAWTAAGAAADVTHAARVTAERFMPRGSAAGAVRLWHREASLAWHPGGAFLAWHPGGAFLASHPGGAGSRIVLSAGPDRFCGQRRQLARRHDGVGLRDRP